MFAKSTRTEKAMIAGLFVVLLLSAVVAIKKKINDQNYIMQNGCKITHEKQGTWLVGTNGHSLYVPGEKIYFCTKTQSSIAIVE